MIIRNSALSFVEFFIWSNKGVLNLDDARLLKVIYRCNQLGKKIKTKIKITLLFLPFLESWIIVWIKMVTIVMTQAKMATPGLLKVRVFSKKCYDVIISVHDVTNNFLSRDLNYIIDVVIWPKFGNWHFYEKSYHNLNFIRIWPEKSLFLRDGLGSSSII